MTKRAIISEIMSLSPADRSEILSLLLDVVGKDGELTLAPDQLKELDRRIDEFELHGSRGEPIETAFASLMTDLRNGSQHNH